MQQLSSDLNLLIIIVFFLAFFTFAGLASLGYFLYRSIYYIFRLFFRKKSKSPLEKFEAGKIVTRAEQNPILKPDVANEWEIQGTFNPAAWHDEHGTAHILYRAVGSDGVSRLGYAKSIDGLNFERLPYPVYSMENIRSIDKFGRTHELRFDPVLYPSGGSYGGAEDPRIVAIEDKLYITCSAFDGWDFIRIAIFSISKKDFIAQKWKWSKLMLISPEGTINKNWVLFPEKINGKFAILHSLSPKIQIGYVDNIEDLGRGLVKIKSDFSQSKEERPDWDTWIRGAGAPPIKTKFGWLVFYHATDKNEPHKYKLGAFILDSKDPSKILARSPKPILVPDMWYENDSKPGVVYVCGAVIDKGVLYVYYGGGDKYACVAKVNAEEILDWIMQNGKVSDLPN